MNYDSYEAGRNRNYLSRERRIRNAYMSASRQISARGLSNG